MLHRVLSGRRDEILQLWTSAIRSSSAAAPVTTLELLDHLPKFLDELAETLDLFGGEANSVERTSTAGKHGAQRFRLGFDLDAVVREYGVLHRCILQVASADGGMITLQEQSVLIDVIYEGMSDAVAQYSRHRDIELRRQANEHFAFIAHELRNPLGSIHLAFTSLRNKGQLPENPLVDAMGRGLKRTIDLVESTLSLSIASDRPELDQDRLDLRVVVADVIRDLGPAATEKEIELKLDGRDKDKAVIQGDRKLVYSAVSNVVGNAIKFSHRRGAVRIAMSTSSEQVAIEVSDCCGGLPSGAAEKMFAPFVQVGADRSGYGLGLAIAVQAVQAHGGSMLVHDRPGEGCTFVIQLPRGIGADGPNDPPLSF